MRAQTYIHVSDLVIKSTKTLDERLVDLLKTNGGRDLKYQDLEIYDIHNSNGFSGYNYWIDGTLVGQLQIASLTSGGYALYKRVYLEGEINETYDYYDQDGKLSYQSQSLDCGVVQYSSINMEPLNPLINHLYNIVSDEYQKAKEGQSSTTRILFIEGLLNKYYEDEKLSISADKGRKDNAIVNIEKEILRIEKDPVLTWTERQSIFASLKEVRSKIITTKQRVHNLKSTRYKLPIIAKDLAIKANRIKKRPLSNIKGMTYKWTIGKFIWFIGMVKDNLGYSVALAIYGPFTFYFISQPMNPHAMWAVGKVRSSYLATVQSLEDTYDSILGNETSSAKDSGNKTLDATHKSSTDSVTTTLAATKKIDTEKLKASSSVKVDWNTRMSHFKAMQIAYESNMVFAARMGRLEQMEAQFNFPLTAESVWQETQRYLRKIKSDLQFFNNLDPKYKSFLQAEIERTENVQVYIWKKMAQFFVDHPYISVDEQEEQNERDYYVGRAFVFMDDITQELEKRNLSKTPATHTKVKKLAKFYRTSKIRRGNILKNLSANSKLFKQKDLFDTKTFRAYMQRHWEVLFLQQNKKQEASSFSLQTYDWSIKNALWTLQSIYSAKREDINTMTYKFNLDNINTAKVQPAQEINELLESMMHMLTIEYVSIKEEFKNNIKNDEEASLRETLIKNEKQYLATRDKLFKSSLEVAGATTKPKNSI